MQREIAHLTAVASFDETLELLERQGGGILPKRQLQEVSAGIVRDFKEFYEQPFERSSEKNSILVVTADGKGVSMHNQDLRPATKKQAEKDQKSKKSRLQPGEKKGRKRMATVVSVYETSPHQRTPEQLLRI
ncbi:MAG: ISKra4 family transposase, partial [Candidatus Electrothrix sp. ATG2]|nr:ISKra4 family transposase [Candidatus Electrothrix sp. ATG2]